MQNQAPPDPTASTFEYLDPEATLPARSFRRELLVGLLLLLLIGGWGGWNWWQEQSAFANYHQGQQAAALYDWEGAQHYYLAAGSYANASALAADAARKITDRDQHYGAATQARATANWPLALRELQALQTVQPEYRDSAAIYANAAREVYRAALSGTVALRTAAQPPGLYLRTADSWIWLAGSDKDSSVRALDNCGYIVYDTPATAEEALSTPAPDSWQLGLSGRRLMAVRLVADQPVFTHFSFDPNAYPALYCLHSGLVAGRLRFELGPQSGADPGALGQLEEFVYQGLDDVQARKVDLGPGALFLAAAREQDRLLVGQVLHGIGESVATHYALINPLDGSSSDVSWQDGQPVQADISPDGTQALLYDYDPHPSADSQYGPNHFAIKVIDLDGGQWTSAVFGGQLGATLWVGTDFHIEYLREGVFAGDILVVRLRPDSRAWLLNGDYPYKIRWTAAAPVGRSFGSVAAVATGLLVSWSDSSCRPSEREGSVTPLVTYVNAQGHDATVDLQFGAMRQLDGAAIHGARLIYSVADQCWRGNARGHMIGSIALAELSGASLKPLLLDSTVGNTPQMQQDSWATGSGLLAYVSGADLLARTYDGSIDVLLEHGVTALYRQTP